MDFKNAKELLTLCQDHQLPISEIMRQREIIVSETTDESVNSRMARVLEIMKDAAFSPVKTPVKSMGGLIGGEAQKLSRHLASGKGICGNVLEKAITYAMATLETNASMGLVRSDILPCEMQQLPVLSAAVRQRQVLQLPWLLLLLQS